MTIKSALKRFWHNLTRLQFDQIVKDIASWFYYRHDAYREVLFYDEENNRYKIERTTITARDFRPVDLPVQGHKYRVFYTDLAPPFREETRIEERNGEKVEFLNPTAVSNYLYMINNDINNAIKGDFKNPGINPLIMLAILGVGAVILIYVLFFKGGIM